MPIPREVLANLQLLIFDLDGTLIDSKLDLTLSVNATRARLGLAPLSTELIASYVGHGVIALMRRALGEEASEEAVQDGVRIFLEYYREHMLDNTVIYPGVREALAELNGRGLAVLTNKPVNFSKAILAGLGIANHFAFVYGGNSFEEKKPNPVGVFKLMADLKASSQETMIIGDSDTDILTGRNAGIWTCGVTYGYAPETFEAVPPDLIIDNMARVPALLDHRGH